MFSPWLCENLGVAAELVASGISQDHIYQLTPKQPYRYKNRPIWQHGSSLQQEQRN